MMAVVTTLMGALRVALLLLPAGGSVVPSQELHNIFFAEAPAILVRVEGDPVYRHIAGTDLERIVNTTALIVRDTAGLHYLKVGNGWMESYSLTDGWTVSGVSPFGENRSVERAVLTDAMDRSDDAGLSQPAALTESTTSLADHPPAVIIATEPAALIITDGFPRYETIPGTSLQRLANTQATVFREPTDEEYYVRVDGDWYRAWTTDGPWQFIPANQLPSDIVRQIAR